MKAGVFNTSGRDHIGTETPLSTPFVPKHDIHIDFPLHIMNETCVRLGRIQNTLKFVDRAKKKPDLATMLGIKT